LLKVTSEGGFINPTATLAALPILEVYDDGQILTPGPVDAIAPGPLLLPVQVRNVGASGAAAIRTAIQTAGLDQPTAGGPDVSGDSGRDVFSVTIDGQTTETRLAGNGLGGPGLPGTHGSEDPGRVAAFALLDKLLDPAETWGASAVPAMPYQPGGYLIYAAPGAPQTDPATTQPPVAWPLAKPLAEFGAPSVPNFGLTGLRQGIVIGTDAATLRPILAKATTATGFTSGGKTWTLAVRVLLPDELGS